jgi:hypothetical protein
MCDADAEDAAFFQSLNGKTFGLKFWSSAIRERMFFILLGGGFWDFKLETNML